MNETDACRCTGISDIVVGDADAMTQIAFNTASERGQFFAWYFFGSDRHDLL
jgi:hypothetical protein